MELEINFTPPPPVKTRRLLALGYIKYRSDPGSNGIEPGPAAANLQVHGLLVIDESRPDESLLSGSEGNYG